VSVNRSEPETTFSVSEQRGSKQDDDPSIRQLLQPVSLVDETELLSVRSVSDRVRTIDEFREARSLLERYKDGLPVGKSLKIFLSTNRIAELQEQLELKNVTTAINSNLRRALCDLKLEVTHRVSYRMVKEGRLFVVSRRETNGSVKKFSTKSSMENW
jgi:hypothetical protein